MTLQGTVLKGGQLALATRFHILQAMIALEAEKKEGSPPRGELERILQRRLKQRQKQK